MGGGLMQLVAYGSEDIYLTGNPQITHFKVIYKRHTNFSIESIPQNFDGTPDFGHRVSCTIARNGDLINNIYLRALIRGESGDVINPNNKLNANGTISFNLPNNWTGYRMIKSASIEIGGQLIDKHYGHWMNVWTSLTLPNDQKNNIEEIAMKDKLLQSITVNANTELFNLTGTNQNPNQGTNDQHFITIDREIYVPLQFWFCRNPGLALPLIALQYHEVKVVIEFQSSNNMGASVDIGDNGDVDNINAICKPILTNAELYVDYIFLDKEEKRKFAQVKHEYLIEQVQFTGNEDVVKDTLFNKNLVYIRPVKELIWAQFTDEGEVIPSSNCRNQTVRLLFNSHDRFSERGGMYFTNIQPLQYHRKCPHSDGNGSVHVYSFALKPEEHQPSGTCNMSKIDTAVLNIKTHKDTDANVLRVYAINYNVLRIMSGMCGLTYSN